MDIIQLVTLGSVVTSGVLNIGLLIRHFTATEHRFTKLEVTVQHIKETLDK